MIISTKKNSRLTQILKSVILLGIVSVLSGEVYATKTLGNIATEVTGSFADFARLMFAVSYVAGLGFFIGSVFKFKQHKDNPTQVPVGTPFALLGVAVCLLFLPGFLRPAGSTIFGTNATGATAGITGSNLGALPGGDPNSK